MRCKVIDVDGVPVRVQMDGPVTDETVEALRVVARAVQARYDAMPADERAEWERRYEAGQARARERNQRLFGRDHL